MIELTRHLAIDLGAESGRIIMGTLCDDRFEIEEIHRFPNGPVPMLDSQRWDLLRIWSEILHGLREVKQRGLSIESVSVDSWGVDYVLVRGREPLIGPAFHYRDRRALKPYEELRKDPGERVIYAQTGIQFMPLNSVYQLVADSRRDPGWIESADGLLMIADWYHWLLTGWRTVEETNASTTQLYDPRERRWAWELIDRLKLPRRLFDVDVIQPGTCIGPVSDEVAHYVGFNGRVPEVVACCTHDTASAVVAVPAPEGRDWAYLSSGTWSLIGVELDAPLLTEEARKANFTNEIGFGGTIRFLRNVVGLWLLQECRKRWQAEGGRMDYAHLMTLANDAEPLRSLIHPDDPRFLHSCDMCAQIQAFCKQTDQPAPEGPAEITRCILESLALLYAVRLAELERVTGRNIATIYIVGGGSQSSLLNQLTADASQREVYAGPVEATAIGNVLVQAMAMGHLPDLTAARKLVANSIPRQKFSPRADARWDQAHARMRNLGARLARD